jgi:hypothetical protein
VISWYRDSKKRGSELENYSVSLVARGYYEHGKGGEDVLLLHQAFQATAGAWTWF